MSAYEDLPADKRAVVELVLRSGRSYDQIAAILSIDRAAVRARALAALDELAPEWGAHLPEARRALITDYLLGQLPPRLAEQVRERLGQEDAERAWAATVAGELDGLAPGPLPEIPGGVDGAAPELHTAPAPPEPPSEPRPEPSHSTRPPAAPRSSRPGGAILLALGALIAVAVIVVLVVVLSGGSSKHASTTGASTPTTPAGTTSSGTNSTSTAATGKPKGAAEVISARGKLWLFVVAVNLPPNNHNYYAVWLTNGPTDSQLIGYANPVASNGRLAAFAPGVQLSYARFKQMVVTVETTLRPKSPGTTVLSGSFSLSSSAPKGKPLALTILNQPTP